MSPRFRFLGRVLLNAAGFLGAFAAACAGIRALLPFPEVPGVRAKLEHFRRHANEYDTLFLGTSRVYHQILPSIFDELTAACGLKTRSLNLALDSLRPPEINFFVEKLLQARPKNLRWVFLENGAIRVGIDPARRGTQRAIYWHDWKRMRLIIRAALADRRPAKSSRIGKVLESYADPLADIWSHVVPFAVNFTNLGRANILTRHLGAELPYDEGDIALGPLRDGFADTGRGEQIAPAQLQELQQGLLERQARPGVVDYGNREDQRAFERLLEDFEKLGARTVQLIPPSTGRRKFHLRSAARTDRLVLDYSDIRKYAVLYEVRHRLDTDHLNHAGAEAFTRILAEEFCAAARTSR